MRKGAVRTACAGLAVLAGILASPGGASASAGFPRLSPSPPTRSESVQETDPFYRRLLESGRRSYLEKDFGRAAQDLEVAAFGLWRDAKLAGKAYVYLALARAALSEGEKSLAALKRGADLLGPDGMRALDLEPETLESLRRLARESRIDIGLAPAAQESAPKPAVTEKSVEKPAPVLPEKKPAATKNPEAKAAANKPVKEEPAKPADKKPGPGPAKTGPKAKPETRPEDLEKPPETKPAAKQSPSAAPAAPDLKALEARVRANAADAGALQEFARACWAAKSYRQARSVLGAVALKRPRDAQAAYFLAKTDFFLRDFETALDEFRALSKPSPDPSVNSVPALRVAIYTALCLDQLGQRPSAASFLSYVKMNTTPEALDRIIAEEGLADYRAALNR